MMKRRRHDIRLLADISKSKCMRKACAVLALGLAIAVAAPGSVPEEPVRVEAAKKDKKKPKIKFKGKTKITANEGQKVTIPATTYSDNKTKKKKLKVGVTVKKGKKNYKTIANKIKKATLKSQPVTLQFSEDGTYKITYTVTNQAKNKATKSRYVTINEEVKAITPDEPQIDNTEESTIVTPTTEETTKVEETTEKKVRIVNGKADYSDFESKKITVGNNTYTVIFDPDFEKYLGNYDDNITITPETDISEFVCENNSSLAEDLDYIKTFGKISATDSNGNDISDNIVIYQEIKSKIEKTNWCYIYCVDNNLKFNCLVYLITYSERAALEYFKTTYDVLSDEPYILIRNRYKKYENLSLNEKTYDNKKLCLTKIPKINAEVNA